MPQPPRDEQAERMRSAAENLKRILEELAPYEKHPCVKEISTAGTWQASQDTSVHIGLFENELNA